MSPLPDIIATLEHRGDRAYDEQDASHLIMPSGTLVASYDRQFLGAAGREIIRLHRTEMGLQ